MWWRIAGLGYRLGDWAMDHVPEAKPPEAMRYNVWRRVAARLDLLHGGQDDDDTSGKAT
jgi:hypothetical protein